MAVLTMGRRGVAMTLAWCLAAVAAVPADAQAPPTGASIKAVFLFNFAKYVTWPALEIGDRSPAEVRVCTTANNEFFGLLKAAIQGEDLNGKPLLPVALDGLDEAKNCQILYVGDTQTPDARSWLNAVRGRQVLTVGDGALNDQTVIAFVRDGNRIRFDINRVAASQRGLSISSKLLRLARQVKEP